MKTLLIILLFSLQALAITESVSGTGSYGGFCRGDGFANICLSQMEDRANHEATRNADLQCRIKNGTLITYSRYCSTFCNPSFIPVNQDVYVNCNANCRFECEILKP